jgi:cystathionine beta-lyase/cystathionine gamma-synthase
MLDAERGQYSEPKFGAETHPASSRIARIISDLEGAEVTLLTASGMEAIATTA